MAKMYRLVGPDGKSTARPIRRRSTSSRSASCVEIESEINDRFASAAVSVRRSWRTTRRAKLAFSE